MSSDSVPPLFRIRAVAPLPGMALLLALLGAPAPGRAAAEHVPPEAGVPAETVRWRAEHGGALPFRTDGEIESFLREASLGAPKVIRAGINRPVRFELERNGVRARAIFRTVWVDDVEMSTGARDPLGAMPDSWAHEIAAWELSRLLGLDHVPPTVERTVDGTTGSLQLWVERARSEAERIEAAEAPPLPARWSLARQALAIFDNLIHNFDRNQGNLLLDERGKLWFIDHTRSFARRPALVLPDRLRTCPRELCQRLRALDPERLEAAVGRWIDPLARRAVLVRRDRILARFDELMAERGETAVLLD